MKKFIIKLVTGLRIWFYKKFVKGGVIFVGGPDQPIKSIAEAQKLVKKGGYIFISPYDEKDQAHR